MFKKIKWFLIIFIIVSIVLVSLLVIKIRNSLKYRKKNRELDRRYYRSSNPNWRLKKPPARRVYREGENYQSYSNYKKRNYSYVDYHSGLIPFFWTMRLLFLICLVIGFPVLLLSFSDSIQGYSIIAVLFFMFDFLNRRYGITDVEY